LLLLLLHALKPVSCDGCNPTYGSGPSKASNTIAAEVVVLKYLPPPFEHWHATHEVSGGLC